MTQAESQAEAAAGLSPSVPASEEPQAKSERRGPTARQNLAFFLLTLAVFLGTRLIGLERFPIFFFCDEAIQTVQAGRFVDNHFRDETGARFPTYFRNGSAFNLSIGVYLQVLSIELFGRSVFVARASQVLVIFSAMVAVGLMLRDFFGLRFWWVGVLVLSAFPGWFLHTRIAFELMLATTAYVWFLYFYLRYRYGKLKSVFPALLFGALTFYGYNTFQPVIVATALLLLVIDAGYHWRNRRVVLWAIPFLVILVLPYFRYMRAHPGEVKDRLRGLGSYWTDTHLSTPQKLKEYGKHYVASFGPSYWFYVEHEGDIARHLVKGKAHLSTLALPFAVLGLLLCVLRARSPADRTLLAALLAAPVGAALVNVGITRAMTYVIVVAMLIGIAADAILRQASRWVPPIALAGAVFAWLAGSQVLLLADALRNGDRWFTDYSLYGMQWGARQVFGAAKELHAKYPKAEILVSPVWANGADDVMEFFLPGVRDVRMCNIDALRYRRMEMREQTLLIMTDEEYQTLQGDGRFTDVRLEGTIPYPDGRPGFRLVWLQYAPDFDQQQAKIRESWHQLVNGKVTVGGESLAVAHSDVGVDDLSPLFDDNPASLVRGTHANPLVFVFEFPKARALRGVRLTLGSMDPEITVVTDGPDGEVTNSESYKGLPPDPTVELSFPARQVTKMRIEVKDPNAGEPTNVHVREVKFL